MEDKFAQVNGISLHYLDYPGEGPTLVLLPGLTANAHSFDGLIAAGLSPRCRVVALDLRGRGLTDKPDSGYRMADHAADVLGLLDVLGLEQVVLGGHSFGGLLTYYIAANFPQRVSRLVAMDAGVVFHPRTRELLLPTLSRLGQVVDSWEAYRAQVRQLPFWGGLWDSAIESFYRADVRINHDNTVQTHATLQVIIEASTKGAEEPWEAHIRAIKQPALLINANGPYGLADAPALLPRELAQQTVDLLADCRYVEVPGNHMTMLFGENAAPTTNAILEFVE